MTYFLDRKASKTSTIASLLAGASMLATGAALAQETADHDDELSFEEIIVSGQVIKRTLNETPASVSVIDAKTIADSTIINVYDMFDRVANVSSSFDGDQFVIRGVAINGPANVASGSLSSIYLDGVPLTRTGLTDGPLSAWDMEQAEFFRGSQSTSQGRNAMAGSIVLRSKEPEFDFDAKARFTAEEHGTFSYQAAAGGGLVEDVVAVRLAASLEETNGVADNLTRNDDSWDEEKNFFVRGKMLIQPGGSEKTRLLLTALYSEKDEGHNIVDLTDPEARISYANEASFTKQDNILLSAEFTSELSEKLTLSSATGYTEADYLSRRDSDNALTEVGGVVFPDFDLSDTTESGFSQEVKLGYNGERLSMVVGGYYADVSQEIDFTRNSLFGVSDDLSSEDQKNYAFFSEADFDLTDKLTLTAGIRYDNEDAEFASAGLTLDATYSAWLPKVGLGFQVNDNVRLNTFVSKGYRAGGAYYDRGLVSEYDPEYTWNYEFAVRTNWLDGDLQFNANIFYTDWKDQQIFILDEFFRFGVGNAAGSKYYGYELELSGAVTDELQIFAAYGYTKTEFDDFQVFAADGVTVLLDLTGNEFRYAPRNNFSAGFTYRADSGFFASGDVSYTSGAFTDEFNSPDTRIDARTIANMKVGYEFESWAIYGQVTNVFDELYLLSNIDFGGRFGAVGQPRTFGVTIDVNF